VLVSVSLIGKGHIYANPDVWVKAGITYQFEDHLVTELTYLWSFDDYFSSRTIQTYDRDKNGVFEPEELTLLRREAFDPLSRIGYHVHIWADGKKLKNLMAKNFDARIETKKLIYEFTVPLMPSANPNDGPIITSLYDNKLVMDFRFFKKNFLLVKGLMRPNCKFQIKRGKGVQSYHPQPVTLKCGE
jgi:ABC-type uncharacterized transport system substrate-binding protein